MSLRRNLKNHFIMECEDLERLIKSYGYDDLTVKCVAEYLDESIIGDVYLSDFIKYRMKDVKCFKKEDEEKAIEYVKNELGKDIRKDEWGDIEIDDVRFYYLNNGIYIEQL